MKHGILWVGIGAAVAALYALAPRAEAHDDQCNADSILGLWLTEKKDARIQIYKSGGEYDGKIVWLSEPNGPDGQPKLDVNNSDPARRSDPVMGLVMVKDLKYDSGCRWGGGTIYDPKRGKTYDSHGELENGGQLLDLRGYIGISLFGRTTTWTRVSQ